jgi:hypothetical protein
MGASKIVACNPGLLVSYRAPGYASSLAMMPIGDDTMRQANKAYAAAQAKANKVWAAADIEIMEIVENAKVNVAAILRQPGEDYAKAAYAFADKAA